MELLLELFMTAFVAICFSFLVAKLVSIAMVDDAVAGRNLGLNSSKIVEEETVMEEVKFDRGGLEFEGTQSKRRVQFVVEEVVGDVDQFGGEGSSDNSEVLPCCEELIENRCEEKEEICGTSTSQIEAEESSGKTSEVVGLWQELVRAFESEEVKASTEGDDEFSGVREGEIINFAMDELIVDKMNEFSGVREGEIINSAMDELIVDEMIENEQADDEIVEELQIVDDVGANQSAADVRAVEVGDDPPSGVEEELNQIEEEKKGLVSDDDDWEGIERSELEKAFVTASNYVAVGGKDDQLSNLESDVQMQFYGLHKVAMEGPCHEAQPMTLKLSARAKWNAWQRLGNISPEAAMEQYITLLSTKDPAWRQGDCSSGDCESDSSEAAKPGTRVCNISTFEDIKQSCVMEREQEKMPSTEGDLTGGSNSVKMDKE